MEYLKAPSLVLSYILSISTTFHKPTIKSLLADDAGLYHRCATLVQFKDTINSYLNSFDHSLKWLQTTSVNVLINKNQQKLVGELQFKTQGANIENSKKMRYVGFRFTLIGRSTWSLSRGMFPVPLEYEIPRNTESDLKLPLR